MQLELATFVHHFAVGLERADHKRPQAINARSHQAFQAGIGPHSEAMTVSLVMQELESESPSIYSNRWTTGVAYPDFARQKCDLCLGKSPNWDWSIEIKLVRFLGDNGKINDNILMHVLSPYPSHRSALTDCEKLTSSMLGGKKAVLLYGYDHEEWSLDPAIEAFERLANARVFLGKRVTAYFDGLIHPVHKRGRVFAWELANR